MEKTMLKTCTKCKCDKDIENFYRSSSSKDGRNSWCKECVLVSVKNNNSKLGRTHHRRINHYAEQMRNIANLIKTKYGCVFCRENDACCLDFHHPHDDKLDGVSFLATKKQKRKFIEEINKCVVVCASCHRKLHANHIQLDMNIYKCCDEKFDEYFHSSFNRIYVREKFKLAAQLGSAPRIPD